MLDREIGLAGPEPENATHIPAAGEARVERECSVDQPDHGADTAYVRPKIRFAPDSPLEEAVSSELVSEMAF